MADSGEQSPTTNAAIPAPPNAAIPAPPNAGRIVPLYYIPYPEVTNDDFLLFHADDVRKLYGILIRDFHRERPESVRIIAFLIWLGRKYGKLELITELTSRPPLNLRQLMNEAALCLQRFSADEFPGENEIRNLSGIMGSTAGAGLMSSHEDRAAALRAVVGFANAVRDGGGAAAPRPPPPPPVVDDRTIFLSFSEGNRVTEEEIRGFFTGRFGDFIESFCMDGVEEGKQPLGAKMVARTAAVVGDVVKANKSKYKINGKKVWVKRRAAAAEASTSSPAAAKDSTSSPAAAEDSTSSPAG